MIVIHTLSLSPSFCQSNTTVTHLDLSDNGLGTEGGVAITAMLKENCYITHLVRHKATSRRAPTLKYLKTKSQLKVS